MEYASATKTKQPDQQSQTACCGKSSSSSFVSSNVLHGLHQRIGNRAIGQVVDHITRMPSTSVVQRQTAADEQEFANVFEEPTAEPEPEAQLTPPNPTATTPPTPGPVPTAAGTFDPLTGSALTDRQTHGLSTDTGPMTAEIESTLFPTGGANPPCNAIPAGFETTVAGSLSAHLRTSLPTLTPTAQPDPMALANETATEAMPIIASHYAPHAPTVSAASFMTHVSRKTMGFGDPIRNDLDRFASFVSWFAGTRPALRTLVGDKCNLDLAWWRSFVGWLNGPGASWNASPHNIRERCALYNTFFTSTTRGGQITFGLGFTRPFIPHTVVHEAMHLFQHADLRTQINRMQQVRASTDIIIEGFAEYLARGVRDQVVTALQAHVPAPLSAADETRARAAAGYPEYFRQAVALRDVLYSHGQDGEESLRRAFFLGEGWRFGLLESAGAGSPIETDRAVPAAVDVLFNNNSDAMLNAAALNAIVAYVKTRSIATVEIVGRTDTAGTTTDNLTLGQTRADSVQAYLVAQGIDASRITTTSHGEADQIPGGRAANRRATVTVIDPRNQFPGTPAAGRP
jgi:outer membrane protein OmpA-like peptidoglycan-associated protein